MIYSSKKKNDNFLINFKKKFLKNVQKKKYS